MKKTACIILAAALVTSSAWASDGARLHPTEPPRAVPSFVFEDASHQQHTLADYRGRYVLLNIWATWCSPCVKEMPSLDGLEQKMGGAKFTVLPVSEDRTADAIGAFYRGHGLTHLPQMIDEAGIAPSNFDMRGLPTTLLIDPQGKEIARAEGDVDWMAPETLAFIQARMTP